VVWTESIELPRPREISIQDDPQYLEHVRRVRNALHEVSA